MLHGVRLGGRDAARKGLNPTEAAIYFAEVQMTIERVARALRSTLGAAALALGAAGASAAYQRAGDRHDRERFPPLGTVIDTDHGPRHVWVLGTGAPAVVIVTCLGGPAVEWAAVARELAEHTTVLLYDRAGLGWSPAAGYSRTVVDMTDELRAVLDAAGIEGPHLIVGHSIGGIVARLHATRHPRDVAGIVLVDSSHERMYETLERHDPRPWYRRRRWSQPMWQRLRWLGVRRLLHDVRHRSDLIATQHIRGVPDDLVEAAVSLELATNTYRGDRAEMAGLHRGLRDAAEQARPLGDVPLTVVTAGPMPGTDRERAWEPAWLPLQADLVAQSTRGRQIRADHAGHHVHRDDPDLVTRAITEAVNDVSL